ncbi:MAG: hypothetical protein LBC61_06480 [Candidatus Peribacteria bacterium]|nr:hypothetical protein [Candidatus Peribacteria bacterium]
MYLLSKPFSLLLSPVFLLIPPRFSSTFPTNSSSNTETSKEFVSFVSLEETILKGPNKNVHLLFGANIKVINLTDFDIVSAFQFTIETFVDELCACELEIISKFSFIHSIFLTSNSSLPSNQISILREKESFIPISLLLVFILASKAYVSKIKLKNKIISNKSNLLIKKV